MSAELLREAAALMRERAGAVIPGPWEAGEHCIWAPSGSPSMTYVIVSDGQAGDGGVADEETTAHIASWHPAVALAVADWLDAKAEQDDKGPCDGAGTEGVCNLCEHNYEHIAALAVARAYLGRDA